MKRKVKVLVVEDEALVALYLTRRLTAAGYEVLEPVATGEEAIEIAGRLLPDVVVMDVHLAGAMDGVEAAVTIDEKWGLPIILATGYTLDQMQDRISQLEPVACLLKPIEFRDLAQSIDAATAEAKR